MEERSDEPEIILLILKTICIAVSAIPISFIWKELTTRNPGGILGVILAGIGLAGTICILLLVVKIGEFIYYNYIAKNSSS